MNRPLVSILTASLLIVSGQDTEEPSPPLSVTSIPATVESVLTFDLRQEAESPWLSRFRRNATGEGGSILPDTVAKALLAAGADRYTLGGRGFGASPEPRGIREEISITETTRPLADLVAALEGLEEVGALEFPHGRLFHLQGERGDRWVGVGGEKVFILSTERALVEEALARVANPMSPVHRDLFDGTPWDRPALLLRIYDRNNPRDLKSPVNEPKDDRPPQSRPFKVLGIRVAIDGGKLPAAVLDVKTEEVDTARRFYRELLEPDKAMKKLPSPGPGWVRLGFDCDPKLVPRFWGRVLLLYGVHP